MRSLVEEKVVPGSDEIELEEELSAGVDEVPGGGESGTWK